MAKGKKGKGKKKKVTVQDPNALTEVDKTFYELTIADLNRKLARLRSLTQELEEKNEQLTIQGEKNEEDKSDIITYLKRMLQEKTNEINELEERIIGMQETRQTETEQFETKIADLEQEYTQMHEQLTSENKLLEGKLNSLEEFRSQRDDLLKKYEEQEKNMEVQEKRHQREMYEIEKKFIISKDKLKKDMEARLFQLSTEFHDASELRIAATTHRVIRENIAVNNELDNMLHMHQKLYRDFNILKTKGVSLRHDAELHEVETKKALAKCRIQNNVVKKVVERNESMKKDVAIIKQFENEAREAQQQEAKERQKVIHLEFKIRILEQNLHNIKCQNTTFETDLSFVKAENERLTDILREGVSCIREALTIKTDSVTSTKSSKKENLLNTLFILLCEGHEKKTKQPSLETVSSVEATYALGDLGFVPKPVEPRPSGRTRRNIATQTADSFEEFLLFGETKKIFVGKSYADTNDSESDFISEVQVETLVEEELIEKSIQSGLFFDEEEGAEEQTEGESAEFDPFAEIQSEGSTHEDVSRLDTASKGTAGDDNGKVKTSETEITKKESKTPEDEDKTLEDESKALEDESKTLEDESRPQEDGSKTPEDGNKTPEDELI